MFCNVCRSELPPPIYEARSEQSITSLCQVHSGKVRVWSCQTCTHLCCEPLPNTVEYYESDYRILLDHEDEDQIYEVQGTTITYRTEHQIVTLLKKLYIPAGARVLDYGCAKGSTPRHLLRSRPDIEVHLFDVSDMYTSYWEEFLPIGNWAIHETPTNWQGRFEVVTSFFALEHIPEPLHTVRKIANLLADDGVFYGIVPDTFGNVADFVVIDHINHFTVSSLKTLLHSGGFNDIQVDTEVHRGALVFTARKTGPVFVIDNTEATLAASRRLAAYWSGVDDRIQAAEEANAGLPSAIYGSGFYGVYIAHQLRNPMLLRCFLDASPFQQTKTLLGRAILPPSQLPRDIRLLYVGLNPKIARAAITELDWHLGRDLTLVYLD